MPLAAWEFSPLPVCTLTHTEMFLTVTVTYDPAAPQPYAIRLDLADGTWPEAAAFGIRFAGGYPLTIGTDRHERSTDGRSLTVRDRGFDNVLDGLALNRTAAALAGGQEVGFSLEGAAPAVAAFRDCGVIPAA